MTAQPNYSRFQLLERPLASPGNCAVCGTTAHQVVDFGLNIDFYGAFYLCVRCLAEGAAQIDMVPRKEVTELEEKAGQSLHSQLMQRELTAVSNEFYESCFNLFSRFPAAVYDPDVPSDDEVDGSAGEEVPDFPVGNESIEPDSDGADASDSGQDSDNASSERSVSVPTDSSDERVEHFSL